MCEKVSAKVSDLAMKCPIWQEFQGARGFGTLVSPREPEQIATSCRPSGRDNPSPTTMKTGQWQRPMKYYYVRLPRRHTQRETKKPSDREQEEEAVCTRESITKDEPPNAEEEAVIISDKTTLRPKKCKEIQTKPRHPIWQQSVQFGKLDRGNPGTNQRGASTLTPVVGFTGPALAL